MHLHNSNKTVTDCNIDKNIEKIEYLSKNTKKVENDDIDISKYVIVDMTITDSEGVIIN
ncbi:MAG: hypothetical protein MJ123_11990 [Lachnospiraceae bacterium]|nr:hypothetical protein [Lachnospiraceae bacterium]